MQEAKGVCPALKDLLPVSSGMPLTPCTVHSGRCSHCPYSCSRSLDYIEGMVNSPSWAFSFGYSDWRRAPFCDMSVSGGLWSDAKVLHARRADGQADVLLLSHTSSLCFWFICSTLIAQSLIPYSSDSVLRIRSSFMFSRLSISSGKFIKILFAWLR